MANSRLKFRAWHHGGGDPRASGRMHKSEPYPVLFWQRVEDEPLSVEVMQFTGLRDKHGEEIYEGDIVQPYMGGEKVDALAVSYDAPRFTMDEVWYHDVEVIGNIHESPELLK